MSNHNSNHDDSKHSDSGSEVDADSGPDTGAHAVRANAHADALLGMADRLARLEKDAAVLRADIVNLVSSVRDAASAPAVPIKAYTISQVGKSMGLKATTVRKMLVAGELPSFKRDGTRRVLVADLDRYLEVLRDRTQREEC